MPDSEQVTAVIMLTQKDYATSMRELSRHRTGWTRRILLWISFVFLASMFYSLLRNSETPLLRVALIAAGAAAFLLFLLVFWLLKYFVYWFAARQFVKKNPTKLGPNKVSVSSNGLSYEGAHADGTVRWSAYPRILETKDVFLFYTQSNFAQILPKRCFEKPDDTENIRHILSAHYKGKLELLT